MKTWPYNVNGFRELARRKLPRPVFDFVDGGAQDEETMRANRAQFREFRFAPQLFVDVSKRDLSTSVGKVRMRLPIVFAPTGLVGLVHPDGELAAAVVAAREQILAVVSGAATYSLEEVAEAAGAGQWIMILPWGDRGVYGAIMDRAKAAGYSGLSLTVDCTVASNRERDWTNGWTVPPRLLGNLLEYGRHPLWVGRTLSHRRGTVRNFDPKVPTLWSFLRQTSTSAAAVLSTVTQRMSWEDMEWIRDRWTGPLAAKGAFTPVAAKRLADIGIDVLFVGNHGGRQLDGLQTGLEQMPALLDQVGDRVDIVIDGGVRRGSDIIKSICLGARACMIGRPWVYALAVGGTQAVEALLQVLEREMDMTMALLGAASIADLNSSYVVRAGLASPLRGLDGLGWPP